MENIRRRHEELKHRVHNFRIPLAPRGQKLMAVVYFTIPVIVGYFIMQFTSSVSEQRINDIKKAGRPNTDSNTTAQNNALNELLTKIKNSKN